MLSKVLKKEKTKTKATARAENKHLNFSSFLNFQHFVPAPLQIKVPEIFNFPL